MDHLPAEVYYCIFHYLNRPDIRTCSFVCKRLNVFALQVYNKMLIIDDYNIQKAKNHLASDNVSEYFKNGRVVRELIFTSRRNDVGIMEYQQNTLFEIPAPFTQIEFLLLLEHLPNIEVVSLTGSIHYASYISYLREASLQHIKTITGLRYQSCDTYQNYLFTCSRYCGTLTSLCLEYTKDTQGYIFHGVGIIDMLNQFKNLKQLVFNNKYGDNQIIFQIQGLCPQLIELTYSSAYNDSLKAIQESLDQNIESISKSNKSLQHLKISLPLLLINYTKYLTSFIEDGLRTVNIQVAITGLCDWIETVRMENASKVMRKLGQLNDVKISFLQYDRTRKTYMINDLKVTKWFQLVNAFKGSKKAFCDVTFRGSSYSQDHFEYNSLGKKLSLIYGLENADGFGDGKPLLHFTLPDRSISNIGPEIVNHLELSLNELVDDDVILRFLKYALTDCINLQYLKVKHYLLIKCYTEEQIGALGDIQNNLNMAHFLSGPPTDDVLDVISTYLPDIEVLVFGSVKKYNVIMDLAPFKSLKRCYFVIPQSSTNSHKSISINFKYPDGKEREYYYNSKRKKFSAAQDKRSTSYSRQSFSFLCNKDVEFTVCFVSIYGILNFNIDKLPDNCYHIPKYSM